MTPVWILLRARLAHRRRALIALALLIALGVGVGLAAVAGARRTASSFERRLAHSNAPDVTSGGTLPSQERRAATGTFDGVESSSVQVGLFGFVPEATPGYLQYYIAWPDELFAHSRPVVLGGRLPDPEAANEVFLSVDDFERSGVEVGQQITVMLFTADFQDPAPFPVTVVGHGKELELAAADASKDANVVHFTPAFARQMPLEREIWSSTRFSLEEGTSVDDLGRQLLARGWALDAAAATQLTRVQDAIRPLVITLALLGGLVLLATVLIASQALSRQIEAIGEDPDALAAMGFTRRLARRLDAFTVVVVALPAVGAGAALAVALSPLAPVGSVREFEPTRGVAIDWTVMIVGALVTMAVLLTAQRIRSRPASAPSATVSPSPLAALGSPTRPALATGVRFAVGGSAGARRRFWATTAYTAAALAIVATGVTFVSGLDRLNDEPERFGAAWDLTGRNAWGEIDEEAVTATLADIPEVEAASGAVIYSGVLDGSVNTPLMGVRPLDGQVWPTVADGRVPRGPAEALVGRETLRQLGASIGDTVEVRTASFESASTETAALTVVGTAVFPPIDIPGIDVARLDKGLAMDMDLLVELDAASRTDAPAQHADMILFDLADDADPNAVIDRFPEGLPDYTGQPTDWLSSLAPAEVREANLATPVMWAIVALLATTVLAAMGHALFGFVRRRRTDFGVLKAIGFTRRQVFATVVWQTAATVVLALAIGIPVGVAAGRWSWTAFARLMGVIDDPVVPVVTVISLVAGSIVALVLVSSLPAALAGRIAPAAALKEE